MSEQHNSTTTVEERQKLFGLWAASVFTVIGLAFFSYATYNLFFIQQGQAAIEDTVLLPITILMFVVSAISFFLIRGHRFILGIWLLVLANLIIPSILGVLVLRNIHPVVITYLITLTTLLAFLVFPRASRWQVLTAAAVTILTIIGIEIWNPAFRGATANLSNFTVGMIVLASLGFLAFFIYQSWDIIAASLRLKIVVWTSAIVVILSIILVSYSVITARQAAIQSAQAEAIAIAESHAHQVRAELDVPLLTARTMANALEAIKDPQNPVSMSRDQVNAMLKQVAAENPSFLATYTLWEPNAFDGLDSKFSGTEGTDDTGRFIPYWVRRPDGSVTVEPLIDYETPGLGDWYRIPLETQKEYTIAPLIYPVAGVDTLMATFTIPILVGGKSYGIAGVDAPITFVQDIVDSVNLYNGKAEAILVTDSGTLIAVQQQPELTNQPATERFADFGELQDRLQAGEAFISLSPDGNYLRVFSPINVGEVGTHYSFSLVIPFSEITAQATAAAVQQSAISIGFLFLSIFVLWILAGQLANPIQILTNAANAISQGDLNATANVQSVDETGVLATTFNTMTAQLRGILATLESRVAERTRNLELAAEVGRTVSQVRALDVMLKDAAELIRKQFDLYYVQVYLTDPSQTNLMLQSGTGAVGTELIRRGHRLPLNTASINGRAAVEKQSVVISDTTASASFKPNPLLPNTRSEMAVPLLIGEKVVGVLDMQSEHAGSLSQEILPAFEALAGQLAIAIQNATLLAETEQARAEVETQARRLSRANWVDYLDAIHKPEETGFVFEQNKIAPMTQAEQSQSQTNVNALTASITVTGEALGNLVVEMEGGSPISRTSELVDTVARQVAQQIENLRLLDSAERYRFEAEEASRRLTREGWKSYVDNANESMSYVYDLKEVRLQNNNGDQQVENSGYSLPLKVRDETIGKLIIQGLEGSDGESVSLATAVTERLGAHIESLRQFEETQRGQIELDKRARQLAAVAEVSSVSSRELDIDKMLHSVVHLTQRKFGLYHAHIFIYNENTAELKIAACGYKEGDEHEGTDGTAVIPLAQEKSLVARSARTRQAVIVNDVRHEEGWLPSPLLPDTVSELAVPLVIGDQILGVLDVQSDIINAFSEEDANIYTTLASQVSTALQNAKSFSKSQQQAERESTLNVISQKIQSATTVEAVLQIAARELGHALGAPMTIAQLSMKDKK